MNETEPQVRATPRRTSGAIPIWLLIVAFACLNPFILTLIKWLGVPNAVSGILRFFMWIGILLGECCFVVVVAGLTRRTWLGGYFLGMLLIAILLSGAILGADQWDNRDFVNRIVFLFMVPALLLVAAAPLYTCRQLLGWRLVCRRQQLTKRMPFQIEDLLCLVAIVATAIVLLRAPMAIRESDPDDYWRGTLSALLALFLVGLIALPLITWLVFGWRYRVAAYVGLLLFPVTIIGVLGTVAFWADSSSSNWNDRMEMLSYISMILGAYFGPFYFGLIVLRLFGFALVRQPHPSTVIEADLQTLDKSEKLRQRNRTRWRIAGALAVMTLVSVCMASLQSWRRATDAEHERLNQIASQLGGAAHAKNRKLTRFSLGVNATDGDIKSFQPCRDIDTIDLSMPNLTDAGLENLKYFPSVSTIRLNRAAITDDGLAQLSELKNLKSLWLNQTQITGAGLVHLIDHLNLSHIRLNATLVDDATSEILPRFKELNVLTLGDTLITDNALRHLSAMTEIREFDIFNTAITDAGLAEMRTMIKLLSMDASSCQITGDGFRHWPPRPERQTLHGSYFGQVCESTVSVFRKTTRRSRL